MSEIPTDDEIKATADTLGKMAESLKDTGYALSAVYFPFFLSRQSNKWIVETVDELGYVWEHDGETLGEAWNKVVEWPGNAHKDLTQ